MRTLSVSKYSNGMWEFGSVLKVGVSGAFARESARPNASHAALLLGSMPFAFTRPMMAGHVRLRFPRRSASVRADAATSPRRPLGSRRTRTSISAADPRPSQGARPRRDAEGSSSTGRPARRGSCAWSHGRCALARRSSRGACDARGRGRGRRARPPRHPPGARLPPDRWLLLRLWQGDGVHAPVRGRARGGRCGAARRPSGNVSSMARLRLSWASEATQGAPVMLHGPEVPSETLTTSHMTRRLRHRCPRGDGGHRLLPPSPSPLLGMSALPGLDVGGVKPQVREPQTVGRAPLQVLHGLVRRGTHTGDRILCRVGRRRASWRCVRSFWWRSHG